MIRQFLNIMHHAKQLPLSIYLGSATQRKALQAFILAQVTKRRLHCRKTARDYLCTLSGVDFLRKIPLQPAGAVQLTLKMA